MPEALALCSRCGAEKDLPLGRCAACGVVPSDADRELAMVCSTRVLGLEALRAAQVRIRRGEAVRPTEALRARARAILSGQEAETFAFTARQLAALALGNLVLSPLLGYAVWFRYRTRAGPAARQALIATIPVSIVLFVALMAWRLSFLRIVSA